MATLQVPSLAPAPPPTPLPCLLRIPPYAHQPAHPHQALPQEPSSSRPPGEIATTPLSLWAWSTQPAHAQVGSTTSDDHSKDGTRRKFKELGSQYLPFLLPSGKPYRLVVVSSGFLGPSSSGSVGLAASTLPSKLVAARWPLPPTLNLTATCLPLVSTTTPLVVWTTAGAFLRTLSSRAWPRRLGGSAKV